MSALHKSLDETIAAIREAHATEMQECKDRTIAAEVEAALLRDQLARAIEARASAERITVKFVTQFAMVEKVFAEVKALAMAEVHPENEVNDSRLPEIEL
jgi:hypothetical protein